MFAIANRKGRRELRQEVMPRDHAGYHRLHSGGLLRHGAILVVIGSGSLGFFSKNFS